jgi:hypothetical protein
VRFTNQGGIEGPGRFESHQQVKSSRDGPGMYFLDRTGKVVGLEPYVIGEDGEISGLASIVPVANSSPQLPSGANVGP